MRKLVKYLKPYWIQCTLGPFCKWMEAVLELILPTIMAYMINDGVVRHDLQVVIRLGLLMIVMVIVGFGFSMVCQYNAALASQGFGTDMRNCLYAHIQTFSYQDIDHFTTSSLVNRLSSDVNQLQLAVAMLIRLVVRAPFIIIGAIVMAMILDFQLSLILVAAVPFISLILYHNIRFSTPLYRQYQKRLDQFARVLQDNFAGIRVVRAFVSQRRERQRAEAHIDGLQMQMMKIARLSSLLNPLTALVLNMAVVLLLYQGVWQIGEGMIAPGVIVAFINYAASILTALVALSNLIVIFTRAAASAQRVNEVLDHVPSMRDGEDRVLHLCPQEAIRFDHVCFSYGEGEDALSDLDLTIRTGECIGIIGGTGAGKTTMIHLLSRFYDTGKGRVLLYGQDVRTIAHQKLCAEVVSVPQINELFYGTIRENVCFGKKHVSDADIWQALQDAQAADFVKEMKKGLDARVERGGANLSGGQRQRLCIARALLRKPSILILDDSCSALDFKTDAALRHALRKHYGDSTRLIVSQRVSTLLSCDRILVLQDGRMAGFDTHERLYETCAVYRNLCQTQKIEKEVMHA